MPRREFKSVQDVVRYLAFLTRETQSGRMDPTLSGKLCYIMNTMLKALELAHLEKQLKRLEMEVERAEMTYNSTPIIDPPLKAIEEGGTNEQISKAIGKTSGEDPNTRISTERVSGAIRTMD